MPQMLDRTLDRSTPRCSPLKGPLAAENCFSFDVMQTVPVVTLLDTACLPMLMQLHVLMADELCDG